jgi:hypothetical protein
MHDAGRARDGRRTAVSRRWALLVAALLVAPALLSSGCGGDDDARSENRPPIPINISVQIGLQKISASPAKFGAGPITLLITNQARVQHTVTIDGPRVRQTVGPIAPEDTATLKVTVQPGEYEVSGEKNAALAPAKLVVGPERPSAQNQLLTP